MELNRRSFLKSAAVVGGAAALTGLTACAPSGSSGNTATDAGQATAGWDEEHDIVIVGGGGAGVIAAIAASETDPNVDIVIYEKMSMTGGSTVVSGGNIGAMGTDNLKEFAEETGMDIYRDDTFEMYYEDKLAAGCYLSDPDLAHAFCYNSLDNFNWLEGLGIKWKGSRFYENAVDEPSDFSKASIHQACQYLMTYDDEGKSTMVNRKFRYNIGSTYKDKSGGGANFQCLLDTLETHPNATLVTEAPVKDIVREGQITGEVQGVVLEDGTRIRAKKAVILAAGGFAGNGEMIHMYDPRIDASVQTSGGIGNTGDMLIAAQLIGGQTINMNCIQIDFGYTAAEPSLINTANSNPFGNAGDYIEVGPDGKRFWTERRAHEQFMDAENMCLHRLGYKTWWRIGDSQSIGEKITQENLDAFAERYGTVCNTLEEVATVIGCDAATLKTTIDNYNSYVDSKVDTEFGKSAAYLTHHLDTPPFYVTEVTYYCRTTPGGLRINVDTQVLDVLGEPIPRLYAAGEVVGNVHGRFRQNGGDSWTDITCFGRIAGTQAAGLDSVEA
ncbi:FAD-dependent oxidoreductase [Adlercreutzia sp. ZJ141]|uniref:FAD-dependent oxidoreductase n=1 Tax=Adlercreutzia sp. ZJ141 TaxID=2709406 RepID=UPI0013EC774E|nr:FAD-dependent oxidoreductase [Adlercreutzia sp. ZJ141]